MNFSAKPFNSGSIGGIDVIRFVAASMVLLYHQIYVDIGQGYYEYLPISEIILNGSAYFHFGWVGVQIFFVISGFVIYRSADRSSSYSFIRGRILRLVPAVWICAPISILLSVLLGDLAGADIMRPMLNGLLFIPIGPWPESAYWTLGIEIVFYALCAMFILLKKLDYLRTVLYALSFISTGFWIAFFFLHDANPVFDQLRASRLFELALLQHAPFFSAGIALQRLASRRGENRIDVTMFIVSAVGGCFEVWAVNDEINAIFSDNLSSLLPLSYFLTSLAVIAFVTLRNVTSTGRSARIMRFMGVVTYPLYLIHGELGRAATYGAALLEVNPVIAILIGFASCLVAAIIIARWLEPWLRRTLTMVFDVTQTMLEQRLERRTQG